MTPAPRGNLISGAVAARIGTPITLTVSGVICASIVIIFHRTLPRPREAAHPTLAKLDTTTLNAVIFPTTELRDDARS